MKKWSLGALVVIALILGYTVWPTMYQTTSMSGHPVRINRFTGKAYMLAPGGWQAMSSGVANSSTPSQEVTNIVSLNSGFPTEIDLTNWNLSALDATYSDGDIKGFITNTSGKSLSLDSVELDFLDGNGRLLGTATYPLASLGPTSYSPNSAVAFDTVADGNISSAVSVKVKLDYQS